MIPNLKRPAFAAACMLLAACTYPKATVVEEPKPKDTPARRESRPDPDPQAPGRVLGLRDPDVASELPESGPAASLPAAPDTQTPPAGETGTVIARPPR